MTAQQLKNSILQLAVQGKLVPQDPNDEPASVLLERITKERERLIKEKKIKKPKTTSRIFRRDGHYYESVNGGEPACIDEQIPFDIPESWEWVKLSAITYGVGSKENQILSKNIKEKGLYPVVSQGAALFDGYADDRDRVIDNIPLVLFGDHTRNVKYIDFPFIIGADGTKFLKPIQLSPKFLYYVLLLVADGLRDRGYARHFSLLQKEYLPLPPIAEQERIITKIESILPTVQSYGNASSELVKLNASITEALKKSILQHAIQGKLVPQDPTDEPASALLERIAKERAKLGKKAAKSMSRIERRDRGTFLISPDGSEEDITNEIPFDIPESWEWSQLGSLVELKSGTVQKDSETGILYVKVGDLGLYENEGEIVTSRQRAECAEKDIIPPYSIIFPKRGGAIYTNKKRYILSTKVCVDLNTMAVILPPVLFDYVKLWFELLDLGKIANGSAIPQINNVDIAPLLIPIPPIKEQIKICSAVSEMIQSMKFNA